jgi:hypothetical protein
MKVGKRDWTDGFWNVFRYRELSELAMLENRAVKIAARNNIELNELCLISFRGRRFVQWFGVNRYLPWPK